MAIVKSLFGLVALLVTVGLMVYIVSLQFDRFKNSPSPEESRGSVIQEPEQLLDTIDMAEDAARALETRNRIPAELLE